MIVLSRVLFLDLQTFVKQYHTTGLVWSGKSAPKVGGVPPPPPGCPPPPPVIDFSSAAAGDAGIYFVTNIFDS